MILQPNENELFKKSDFIWLDGKFVKWDDAKIHIATHALHYASLVFEGIRAYKTEKGTAIFRGRDHIRRLFESAKILLMDLFEDTGYSEEDLLKIMKELLKKNKLEEAYIRPIAFRSYMDKRDKWGFLGINPLRCKVSVAILAFEWKTYGAPFLKMITAPLPRPNPASFPTMVKASANYLLSQMAVIYARMLQEYAFNSGFLKTEGDKILESYEALMLDDNGYVTEGAVENIFMVKEGKIYTTPVSSQILRGMTRDTVITLLRDRGYIVIERNILLSELYVADEVFITGTAAEIKPVVEIDFRKIGNGDIGTITKEIKDLYEKVVHGKVKEYEHWLDYVV